METYAYGFPRLGKKREFKKIIEAFWEGKISEKELISGIEELEKNRILTYQKYVDAYPEGEITLYDNMLDTALLFGIYKADSLTEYFDLCRGKNALELTKWFNTNYHYLVPDFSNKTFDFKISPLVFDKYKKVKNCAYFISPFTFLKLSKNIEKEKFPLLFESLTKNLIEFINQKKFKCVHLDDPALVMDLSEEEWGLIKKVYKHFENCDAEVYLFTYYDSVDNLPLLFELPFSGIGVDLVHDRQENLQVLKKISSNDKIVFAGVIDGRNVWRNNLLQTAEILKILMEKHKIVITNACPLFHLPINLDGVKVPEKLLKKIAFAEEKLKEIRLLAEVIKGNQEEAKEWISSLSSTFGEIKEIKEKINSLTEKDFIRTPSYKERRKIQEKVLNLPLFPVTTIGSFPQTEEVRRIRLLYKQGKISSATYQTFIKGEIAKCIYIQESIGADVLVHGEFERSDMVEYFAEKLEGITTTGNGWIISYGTRCYRPPIIYGDIKRKEPMTINEIAFAQSLTKKPVKGMLTGPVTIIAWSYVREDIPIKEVAYQLALALREEIKDYEKAGIKIIQIDEPAIREKAPIKKKHWDEYFDWAIKAFRLCHASALPETQIHTHMCYSEFDEIIEYILEMDFDVISIEASRSKGDIIEAFEKVNFDRQIGLGVWDIHSPYVPSVEEMEEIAKRALKVIPKENFWINPDCGLKTRKWEEVIPAIYNLTKLAKKLREACNA